MSLRNIKMAPNLEPSLEARTFFEIKLVREFSVDFRAIFSLNFSEQGPYNNNRTTEQGPNNNHSNYKL